MENVMDVVCLMYIYIFFFVVGFRYRCRVVGMRGKLLCLCYCSLRLLSNLVCWLGVIIILDRS
jgi:hypothetical protein